MVSVTSSFDGSIPGSFDIESSSNDRLSCTRNEVENALAGLMVGVARGAAVNERAQWLRNDRVRSILPAGKQDEVGEEKVGEENVVRP